MTLSLEEYQEMTAATAGEFTDPREERCNWSMGLAGETGELVDLVKKHVFHGKFPAADDLIGELGDVLWYLARLAASYGVSLETVAERNIAKLRERYPQGFQKGGGHRP